jgi:hypothetical protein
LAAAKAIAHANSNDKNADRIITPVYMTGVINIMADTEDGKMHLINTLITTFLFVKLSLVSVLLKRLFCCSRRSCFRSHPFTSVHGTALRIQLQ